MVKIDCSLLLKGEFISLSKKKLLMFVAGNSSLIICYKELLLNLTNIELFP